MKRLARILCAIDLEKASERASSRGMLVAPGSSKRNAQGRRHERRSVKSAGL